MQLEFRPIEIASIAWWTFSSPQLPAYSFVHLSTSEPARKVFLCNIYRKKTTSGELNYVLKRNDPLKTLYNWLSYALHCNSEQECNTGMSLTKQTVINTVQDQQHVYHECQKQKRSKVLEQSDSNSSKTQTLTQQYTKMLQFKTVLKHVTVLKLYHDKQLKHCEHSFKADVKRQTWQTMDCLELWQYTTYKLTNRCHLLSTCKSCKFTNVMNAVLK